MKVHRLKFALLCALLFSIALPVAAKDKWINLHSKNFNVVSNADEGETRKLVLKLEQFRFVFSQLLKSQSVSPLPITVVVFKNDDSYKPFKPLYNGKPANVAGYFQRTEDENLITLNISASSQERPLGVIFHEYTHYLTSNTPRPWPMWLNEGIAELYSSFEVNKNQVTLGAPIASHVYFLREKKFVPLQTLFNVAHNSPIYNERDKQGVFYAQSWALVHYLMFGDKMARQPQLVQYIRLLYTGLNPDEAFVKAFSTDPATMEKDLHNYIGKSSYDVRVFTLETVEGEKDITVSPLSDAEVQYYLGKILLKINRVDESEPFFKQALALDANLTGGYEGLGFVAMRHKNFADAKEQFKQATARDSKNFLAHFYYAETLEREASEKATPISPEVAKTMREELQAAIKLMPSFAPAYSLLGFVCLTTGENLQEGVQAMQTALQLEPQKKFNRLNLANLQVRLKSYDAARKTLQPLLNAADDDDSGLKTTAQAMLKTIDDYEHYDSRAKQIETKPAYSESKPLAPGETPQLKRRGSTAEATKPPAPPSTSSEANNTNTETTAKGVLVAIECPGNGMILVFQSSDQMLRFTVSDPINLKFFSREPNLGANIGCGAVNLPAVVHFKPLTGSQFAGDAVAVEFMK